MLNDKPQNKKGLIAIKEVFVITFLIVFSAKTL